MDGFMTFSEIKELHDMGFTPEQIIGLSGTHVGEEPEEVVPEETAEETEPAEQKEPEQPPEDTRISDLQREVENLKKELQKQNRQNARLESPPDDLQTQTDKIMAELIRPTIKEDKP